MVWDLNLVTRIKKNMQVTVRGDGLVHHGSVRDYFSFGFITNYGMNKGASYGKVSTKEHKMKHF